MTADEKAAHKEKVRVVMMDHLVSVGFPNLSNDKIMNELKNLWIKLEEANLIVSGMSFRAFQDQANNQYLISQVNELMGL